MPHDDTCPPGFVSGLVACLDANPQVVLAYPNVHVVGRDGRTRFRSRSDVSGALPRTVPPAIAAFEMLVFDHRWLPHFHGVFRREPVTRAGLWIRPTSSDVEADVYWVFGIGLLGELRRVPECHYLKRIDGNNTSVRWGRRELAHVLDGVLVPLDYLSRSTPNGRATALATTPLLALWACLRGVGNLTQRWRWPDRATRERVRELLRLGLSPVFGRRPD
jgi:hypothetical protein